MTSPCSIEGCDKPAQGAVGQGPLAQHWGSRKAFPEQSSWGNEPLQLEGEGREERITVEPGWPWSWGKAGMGWEPGRHRDRTTDHCSAGTWVLKRAPLPPYLAQGGDWPGPEARNRSTG